MLGYNENIKNLLTESEVKEIFKESRRKFEEMDKKTNHMFEENIENMSMRRTLKSTIENMKQKIEDKKKIVLDKEAYNDGWVNKDPYFLLCFKAISPGIYKFYMKGYSSYELKSSYRSRGINDRLAELIGKDNLNTILEVFTKKGEEYQERLSQSIIDKLGMTYLTDNFRGVPKSIVMEWLAKIRKNSIDPENLEILKVLYEHGKLSTKELTNNVSMSYPTVRRRINKINQYIEEQKVGKKKKYWLNKKGEIFIENMVKVNGGD